MNRVYFDVTYYLPQSSSPSSTENVPSSSAATRVVRVQAGDAKSAREKVEALGYAVQDVHLAEIREAGTLDQMIERSTKALATASPRSDWARPAIISAGTLVALLLVWVIVD